MKLPIGIQTFSEIREDDYLYIDKTKEAFEIIDSFKYVFLSRPRRFGKSLFLDTLRNIFEGKKEYFKGLYIEDKYNFHETFPVIKISFAGALQTEEGLEGVFRSILQENTEYLGINCNEQMTPPDCLLYLIRQAYKKYNQKVVVLIDEYDKPILDNITDLKMVEYAKKSLKGFYEVLKKSDEYIRFVFLTGVSKFSKVSIFSGLNNIEDITLNPKFGNICGYTQNDIESTIKPLLEGVDLEKLKVWYNGYNFLKDKVYNPFDILLFIRNDFQYDNYWFETGTPSFLINLLKEKNYYLPDLDNLIVGKEIIRSFDIENINLTTLLVQSGYLTIKEMVQIGNEIHYSLKVPNMEVQMSLNSHVLLMLSGNENDLSKPKIKAFQSLHDANLEGFKTALVSLFAGLPYHNYAKNNISIYEGFYASVVYAYLASLGFPMAVEESTNRGRLDMTVIVNNNRYVIEFKVGGEDALGQIKENRYHEKFLDEGSNIYLVGINFNEEERNVSRFEWERVVSN